MADQNIPFDVVESAAQHFCNTLRKYCGNRRDGRDQPSKQANVRVTRARVLNAPNEEGRYLDDALTLCDNADTLIAKLKKASFTNSTTTAANPGRDSRLSPHTSNETPRQLTTPAPNTNPTTNSKRCFHLARHDMGKQLRRSISTFYKTETFDGFITFDAGHIDWKTGIRSLNPLETDDRLRPEQTALRYEVGKPFPHIRPVVSKAFPTQEFGSPGLTAPLSDSESESFLNRIQAQLPEGNIPYYVGPVTVPGLSELLDSGDDLRALQETDIPGVNTMHIHYGEKNSGTACHCEDGRFRSVNVVVYGYKIFLLIAPKHSKMFEDYVRRSVTYGDCAQFVRHLSILVSPQQLRDEGIEFTVRCLGPGDGVATLPGQYHMVVNCTTNVAFSINFTLPNEPPLPDELHVCEYCGLYGLDDARIKRLSAQKRPRQATAIKTAYPVAPKKRSAATPCQDYANLKAVANCQKKTKLATLGKPAPRMQQTTSASSAIQDVENAMKSEVSWFKLPDYSAESPPSPTAFRLAAMVCSSLAIKQFSGLVRERRSLNRRGPLRVEVLSCLDRSASFIKLQQRLIQIKVFEDDRDMKEQGVERQQRLTPDQVAALKIKYKIGMLKTLNRHKLDGQVWSRLIGTHDGLLCFLILQPASPFYYSLEKARDLPDWDIHQVHRLLDNSFAKAILRSAKAFQDSLYSCHDVVFRWENSGVCLDTSNLEEMLELLQPLPFTDQNIWEPELFHHKPSNWPHGQEWPADPTALAPEDSKRCDYCLRLAACECKNTTDYKLYQLKYWGEELGLQAVAQEPGAVAYEKGSFLGVRAGEIVPADKFNDRWTVEFRRPDFEGKPVVCAIRTANRGNCFGLLRHSEHSNVCLRPARRNGRWVLAVEACRDIMDGEQITLSLRRNGCESCD